MDYEALKRYPQREIDILSEVMNNINKQRAAAYSKAAGKKNSPGSFNPSETIGFS